MEDRLVDLENKFSFQEDIISELNAVVIRHQQQLDRMRLELTELRVQVSNLQTQSDTGDSGDERPPHY